MSAFVLPVDETDPVGFALSYPFARPAGSFLFDAAAASVEAAADVSLTGADTSSLDGIDLPLVSLVAEAGGRRFSLPDRVPVLASGSNAAPSQLARKYRDHSGLPPILVHEVEVRGLASVYSAHVARYGSVAATLLPCPGHTSRLHLLFVPLAGMAHLNATESLGGNYLLAALDGMALDVGGEVVRPLAYVSRRGPARFDGAPFRLPETGGPDGLAFATQEEVQLRLHAMMRHAGNLRDFVAELIARDNYRASVTRRLAADTARVVPEGARVLAGG